MFWRKRKPQMDSQPTPLVQLAGRLGVERRYAVRIRYPQMDCQILPAIFFQNQPLKVHDISTGGCCLLDAQGLLGASVGNDVHLILRWPDGAASVHGRIVSRVDHKRHIQFLNMPKVRVDQLRQAIHPGSRGLNVRPMMKGVENGPVMQAREMWSSLDGDSVIIEDHVHRLAQIILVGSQYTLYKHAWPVKDVSTPVTRNELAHLILFLCNIPQPSDLMSALVAHVETMAPQGAE